MNSSFESPVQTIHHPLLAARKIQLSIKRDDLIHPQISGNKWRKLKFNLDVMHNQNIWPRPKQADPSTKTHNIRG